MGEYEDGYSDGTNQGWDDGAQSICETLNDYVGHLEAGDMDFEAFVGRVKELVLSYT